MTQTDRILNWLHRRPLNPQQALREFGCFRLAARINELRQEGHDITTEIVSMNGKRWARYRMASE